MALHLITLGGLRTCRDDLELDWLPSRRLRAALFVHLAVERRAARESLAALFWPESTTENARHALRQCLYHLRRDIGDDWLEVRAHELLASASVRVDVHDFAAALERGDSRAGVQLYHGPFLAGVNLLDLQPWESWVEGRRVHYARAFRKACREWVDALEAAGDLPGAVEAAQRWTGPDPLDDEAQHRLIAALAAAGERTTAIRQFEAYERLLEAEGLHPLEDTAALIERVRSGPADGTVRSDAQSMQQPDDGQAVVASTPPAAPASLIAADGDADARPAEVRGPPGSGRRLRRSLIAGAAAGILLLVVAATRILSSSDADTGPAVASTDLAVFPFSVRGGAQYLGEGMVTLLGTALDGATIRPVDGRAVLGTVAQHGGTVPDLEAGARLASRLGAGMYVLGDVVEAGDRLRIEAAVYRAGRSGGPVARGSVTGEAELLFDLVDRLAAQLLAGLGGADDPLTRTAAVTTASLPAFKDYLQGGAEMRAGRFERAIEAYRRATDRDSTFAVAHYRLALARDLAAHGGSEEAARAATRHAARLAPRDRAQLEAFLAYIAGDADEAERLYRAMLARYPEDLEAWFQLAEVLFHYGTVRGRPAAETEEAWRRVLAYEPRSLDAVLHLARMAAADGRVATIDSLLAPFAPAEPGSDRRLLQVAALRALASGDSARLRTLVETATRWEDAAAWQLAAYLAAFSPEPTGARRALRVLIEPRRAPGMLADLHWFTALLHLENGQLAAARRAHADALAAIATIPRPWHRRTFPLVTEWWMATLPLPYPDSMLERVRRTASGAKSPASRAEAGDQGEDPIWFELFGEALGSEGRLEALRLFTLGQLSLRLDDAAEATKASDALTRLAAHHSSDWFLRSLDLELRARRAWHDGDPAHALRILENDALDAVSVGATIVVPFLAHAQQRYLRGELLTALGRDDEALPWFASLGRMSVPEIALRAPAHLRQAEIHERLGNRQAADRHYDEFLRLWGDSDAELERWLRPDW